MKDPRDIIIRPLITEASSEDMERHNKYHFVVARDANKIEIRRAVEELFKVRVTAVNTMRRPGKVRRVGRFVGKRPDWKKAVVTVAPGQKIQALAEIR